MLYASLTHLARLFSIGPAPLALFSSMTKHLPFSFPKCHFLLKDRTQCHVWVESVQSPGPSVDEEHKVLEPKIQDGLRSKREWQRWAVQVRLYGSSYSSHIVEECCSVLSVSIGLSVILIHKIETALPTVKTLQPFCLKEVSIETSPGKPIIYFSYVVGEMAQSVKHRKKLGMVALAVITVLGRRKAEAWVLLASQCCLISELQGSERPCHTQKNKEEGPGGMTWVDLWPHGPMCIYKYTEKLSQTLPLFILLKNLLLYS